MRLFFAVNFNNNTRSQLLTLRDALRSRSESGNFSAPENLHLTLAFLGECNAAQTAAAKAVLNGIHFEPFDLLIDRMGRFKRSGGDIWWAGLRKSKPLQKLQQDLTGRLTDSGFHFRQSEYHPHITLGREVITAAKPWQIKPFGEIADTVELMKSERIGGKLRYSAVAHAKMPGSPEKSE